MKKMIFVLFLSATSATSVFAEGSSPIYDAKGLEVANPVYNGGGEQNKVNGGTQDPTPAEDRRQQNMMAIQKTCVAKPGETGGCSGGTPMDALDKVKGAQTNPVFQENTNAGDMPHRPRAIVGGTQDPTPAERKVGDVNTGVLNSGNVNTGERSREAFLCTAQSAGKSAGNCVDKDKDGDPSLSDCDDKDPKRHRPSGACPPKNQPPVAERRDVRGTTGWRSTQGSQGIGIGFESGSATVARGPRQTTSLDGSWPHSVQLEYFNVGKNPSQKGSGYGLQIDRVTFSGVSGGIPQMALETRGMSGWQVIGASDKRPVMFHLGLEPTNFEGQVTSHLPDDARNTAARIAQSKDNVVGTTGGLASGAAADQIGNPNAPVTREQFMYYVPAVSVGLEVRKLGCRFLGLVRGGAAGGGQLHAGQAEALKGDSAYSYGVAAAYGAGAYVNCPQVDVVGEWTRIAQSGSPVDMLNADVMIKPFKNIPLAVGAELGSTVVNSRDPKNVPVAFPGYGTKGASVETHAGGTIRVVF